MNSYSRCKPNYSPDPSDLVRVVDRSNGNETRTLTILSSILSSSTSGFGNRALLAPRRHKLRNVPSSSIFHQTLVECVTEVNSTTTGIELFVECF